MAAPGGFPDWLRSLDPGEREQVAAALDWEEASREAATAGMVRDPWQDFDAWVAGAPDPGPLMVEPEDPYDPSLLLDPWEGFDPGALVDPDPSALFAPTDPSALAGSADATFLSGPSDLSAPSGRPEQRGSAEPPVPAQLTGLSQQSGAVEPSGPGEKPDHPEASGRGRLLGLLDRWGHWQDGALDPLLAAEALAGVDPATLDDEQVLDYVSVTGKMMSWLQARQYRAAAGFAAARPPVPGQRRSRRDRTGHPGTSKYAAAEIALVLNTSKEAALKLIYQGQDLVELLPNLLALYEAGVLDAARIRTITGALVNVPAAIWPEVEADILPVAASLTMGGLGNRVNRVAEKLNPEPLAVRHERARESRDVYLEPLPDGMADLIARLPAVEAVRYYETLDAHARHAKDQGESSTGTTPCGQPSRAMSEYRADCLMDLLDNALDSDDPGATAPADATGGNGEGSASGRRVRAKRPFAQVAVTVGVQTLMGLDEKPGYLDGYGPIPPEQARELAGTAKSWLRILTDPEKGTILSIGRKRYKPPKSLRRWIEYRDQDCRGIGCRKPARSCEIDHTIPYFRRTYAPDGTPQPLGETSHDNLGAFSTYWHHVKDDPESGWTVTQPSPGTFLFTTPTGRTYRQDPEPPPF